MSGLSILAFTAVQGYNGYVVFVWIFGIFSGGYHYSLKMYIYEKVRARNFARAWGFAQFSMSLPNMFGVPISGKHITSLVDKFVFRVFAEIFYPYLFMLFIHFPIYLKATLTQEPRAGKGITLVQCL